MAPMDLLALADCDDLNFNLMLDADSSDAAWDARGAHLDYWGHFWLQQDEPCQGCYC